MITHNYLHLSFIAKIAPPITAEEKTLLDIFTEGGWVMYPILLCSVAMIWFIVDGWIRSSPLKLYPALHVNQLRELFKRGDYPSAHAFTKSSPSAFNNVVRTGLTFAAEGKTMSEESILAEINRVQADLMGRASYLSVIGVCTPMIGLTGTVTGMMKAFDKLGTSGVGDPSQLAGAIGEVLVATASGLFIAIPAFVCYYLLRNRIQKGVHDIHELTTNLFRCFPYQELSHQPIGDDEIYAAKPYWMTDATSHP